MHEAVRKFYRGLIDTSFEHAGLLENASIFVENDSENMSLCANEDDYMQLYINVVDNYIDDIKYACTCDPTANVAVEVLCSLIKGKSLDEAAILQEKEFYKFLGGRDKDLRNKIMGLLELLTTGIAGYKKRPD
jgi:NifU-like protein involved in Fe-S cluster formation